MIRIDEKKLDRYYQEYLNSIAENPEISHNLKDLAPANWYSTNMVSCIFASILESNFHDLVTMKEVKFETIKNEDKSYL
jgi:hypothetical protein